MLKRALLAASLLCASASAHANIVVINNFDGEAGGLSSLNYTGFSNLNVIGKVDVVKSGTFGITCTGSCVDLDGTKGPGELKTDSFAYGAGDYVEFSFTYGGSQRGKKDDWLYFGVSTTTDGVFGGAFNVPAATVFGNTYSIGFNTTGAGSLFAYLGTTSNDAIGPLVDDFTLSIIKAVVVPEPATWAMMITGFGLIGGAMRRKKAALNFA